MDFNDLRELFHLHVPEYHCKWPLSDTDSWDIFVNVSLSVALVVGLLLFGLLCKLKHRWLVNAKCAFCNCVVRVCGAKLYWWFCKHCQPINGHPKNSLAHADSSTLEDTQEIKDDSFKLMKMLNVSNNQIKSPSNRKRIIYPKNDLNDTIIISHSPKDFRNQESDLIELQEESNAQIETSFQKIRNKFKEMLDLNRGIEQLSNDAKDDINGNSTRLPSEMSNLRKMHMKLMMDDVNRRYELLNAEKALCAKMKQMKELERTLRDAQKNATPDPLYLPNESFNKNSHSIRRRNTFFERSIDHSVTSPNNLNSKDVNLTKDAVATRLAILESHLTELRDMHVNEIKLLKSQMENNASIVKKLEYLKFEMVEYQEKIQRDYEHFNFYKTAPRFNSTEKLQFEKPNEMLHSDFESGYLSESGETKNHLGQNSELRNEMSVIVEECDSSENILSPHHIDVLKRTVDHFKQAKKRTIDKEESDENKASIAKRRGARIVKPIRAGQRPAASKVV